MRYGILTMVYGRVGRHATAASAPVSVSITDVPKRHIGWSNAIVDNSDLSQVWLLRVYIPMPIYII